MPVMVRFSILFSFRKERRSVSRKAFASFLVTTFSPCPGATSGYISAPFRALCFTWITNIPFSLNFFRTIAAFLLAFSGALFFAIYPYFSVFVVSLFTIGTGMAVLQVVSS